MTIRTSNQIVIPECLNARAHVRSTSLRALARALFGMSLSLIFESVREELDVLLRKCRGSIDSRLPRKGAASLKHAGMTWVGKSSVVIGVVSLLITLPVTRISADSGILSRFKEANQLYAGARYEDAAKAYEGIAKIKPVAEVYFNLGNAYFKSKKLGQAILNYQRARHLNPRDSDVLANLSYANRLLEYKIDDKRNWFVRKKTELLNYVTLRECWLLVLPAYFVFMLGLFIALLRKQRPVFGRMGALSLCLVIFCSFPLLLKYGERGIGRQGVVTEAQAEVRYGPSSSDRIAFRLVEGLEVSINDEKQDWYRIQLIDGRSGWVSQSQVTAL